MTDHVQGDTFSHNSNQKLTIEIIEKSGADRYKVIEQVGDKKATTFYDSDDIEENFIKIA